MYIAREFLVKVALELSCITQIIILSLFNEAPQMANPFQLSLGESDCCLMGSIIRKKKKMMMMTIIILFIPISPSSLSSTVDTVIRYLQPYTRSIVEKPQSLGSCKRQEND